MPGRARQTPGGLDPAGPLAGLLQSNGIDIGALMAEGGMGAASNEYLGGGPANVNRQMGLRSAEGRAGTRSAGLGMAGTWAARTRPQAGFPGLPSAGRDGGASRLDAKGFYPTSGTGSDGAGYREGDVDKLLRGMSREEIKRMQQQMAAAGISVKPTGLIDGTTSSAFKQVLVMANLSGQSYKTTLTQLSSTDTDLEEMRAATKQRLMELEQNTKVNVYERSDPASLREAALAAFKETLGRSPRKGEAEKFVNSFLGAQRASQATVFNAQDAEVAAQRGRLMESAALIDTAAAGTAGGAAPEGGSESAVLMARLEKFIADAPGKIKLGPTTRSYATQVALKKKELAGGPKAATPGKSKHGDGRANDLAYENEATRQWALKNAAKYGLAFPIYDPKKMRSHDESWHIEVAKGSLPPGHAQGDGHSHGAPAGSGMAPISTDVTAQAVDPVARAKEQAIADNPAEAGAYQIGSQFDALLAMIQKGL